ncbi:MAG: serpin family protein [Bacteroidales bacterium]
MKTIKYLLTSVYSMMIISGCEVEPVNQDNAGDDLKMTKSTEQLISADNQFGIELFKTIINNESEDSSVFISPTSVALALAMAYNGADGSTKKGMEKALRKSGFTDEEINQLYHDLMEYLKSTDPGILLEIANSIWIRDGFHVEDDFINLNKSYYTAEIENLDFNSPSAPETINGWVAEKTHDKITAVLDKIPPKAVMYLINAIYFNGTWQYEFDEDKTGDESFSLASGTSIMVPTMQQQEEFNYFVDENVELAELPYGDGTYSMLIAVPRGENNVHQMVEDMDTSLLSDWLNSMQKVEIIVHLPKFQLEYKKILNEDLISMGMSLAFSPNLADFSKINPATQLYISFVLHKTFVEVNEEGTEAAAVTVIGIEITSVGGGSSTPHFRANRPFLFMIKENKTNAIVFMGKIMKPVWTGN